MSVGKYLKYIALNRKYFCSGYANNMHIIMDCYLMSSWRTQPLSTDIINVYYCKIMYMICGTFDSNEFTHRNPIVKK